MTDKNKNNIVNWPDANSYFTISEIGKLNPHIKVNITLRTKINKAREEKKIVSIGDLQTGHGRPEKVFTYLPVSPEVLEQAKQNKNFSLEYRDGNVPVTSFSKTEKEENAPITEIELNKISSVSH